MWPYSLPLHSRWTQLKNAESHYLPIEVCKYDMRELVSRKNYKWQKAEEIAQILKDIA